MKKKVICGLLACAIFISAALPMVAYATDATDPAATPAPTADDGLWHVSDNMLTVLKAMEGFAEYAYWDYEQWSIGYGSKCPDDWDRSKPISREYAEQLLRGELDYFEQKVNQFISSNQLQHITQNKYDALVSCTYNIGAGWMTDSDGNLCKAVLSGDVGSRFAYSMLLWSKAGGQYILLPRRIREAYMYIRGEYTSTAASQYQDDYFRYVFMDANGGKVNYYVHGFYTPDPTGIRTKITSAPTGPDESGSIVTYVFDGWYTQREGGTKVETLDSAIASGSVLYAHWKTPSGTPVTMPQPDAGIRLKIKVIRNGVNIRSGPQTYFAKMGTANNGDEMTITDMRVAGGREWGRFGDSWICLNDSNTAYTNYNEVTAALFPAQGVVTANGVNVRSGASTDKSVVATKNKGDVVTVKRWVSDGERMWGEIEEGFIAMSYVSLGNEEEEPEKATVTFKMDDGSLISEKEYTIGEEVVAPQVSAKPGEQDDVYIFAGWDKEVTACTGDATYTAVFNLEKRVGDINKDGRKNDRDVVYLLDHMLFQEDYPFAGTTDLNADGRFNDRDIIYLLDHILFPEDYPLPT